MGSSPPHDDAKLPKRTCAMHVAYIGTSFRGSAINRSLGEDATVEAVLERALLKAGLISVDNFGSFHKMKWTRASRTDKGVHSLGTVTALRMNMDDASFHKDSEGTDIADSINQHLPSSIKVLSVQKVNKKFNARHLCCERRYEYYLPCSMIDVTGSTEADQDKIERFRAALRVFEGNRAFHNYTKVKPHDGARDMSKRYSLARQAEAQAAKDRGEDPRVQADVIRAAMKRQAHESKLTLEQGTGEVKGAEQQVEPLIEHMTKDRDEDNDNGGDGEDEEEGEEEEEEGEGNDANPSDPEKPRYEKGAAIKGSAISFHQEGGAHVSSTYYRKIFTFTADDPAPVTQGGALCLRLSVHGQSFLLHHIRHMIGSACAVTLGVMPLEAIEASLSPASKIILPLAPSHTLLLSDTTFRTFPVSYGAEAGDVMALTGPNLMLRTQGIKRKEEFRLSALHQALQLLIDLNEWNVWKESLLHHGKETYKPEVIDPFLVQYRGWKEALMKKRMEREAAGLSGEEEASKPPKRKWEKKERPRGDGKPPWWAKRRNQKNEGAMEGA